MKILFLVNWPVTYIGIAWSSNIIYIYIYICLYIYTVEPRFMVTPVMQSPRHYGHPDRDQLTSKNNPRSKTPVILVNISKANI